MDDDTMKKLGVWVIVALFALYVVSVILIAILTDFPTPVVIVYSVIMLTVLAVLAYEGWQRIKEIDGGLEDAVDNY